MIKNKNPEGGNAKVKHPDHGVWEYNVLSIGGPIGFAITPVKFPHLECTYKLDDPKIAVGFASCALDVHLSELINKFISTIPGVFVSPR